MPRRTHRVGGPPIGGCVVHSFPPVAVLTTYAWIVCRSSINRTLDSIQSIIKNAPEEDLTDILIEQVEKAMESRQDWLQREKDYRERTENLVYLRDVVNIHDTDDDLLTLKIPNNVAMGTLAWCREHDMNLHFMSPRYVAMHHGNKVPDCDVVYVTVFFGTTAWKSYYFDDDDDMEIDLLVPIVLQNIYQTDNHPLILPHNNGKRKRDDSPPSERPDAGPSSYA
jgi:hypothetical protein